MIMELVQASLMEGMEKIRSLKVFKKLTIIDVKANEMLCTFLRSIHISIFLYKVVLSFGTCSPPTLICMYALHNGVFYKQYEPKKVGCARNKIGLKGDGFFKIKK